MKLLLTLTGLAHGLCDTDTCLQQAAQNNWDKSAYTACTKLFVKSSNLQKKKSLRQLSRTRRSSPFASDDADCPFVRCAELHDLSNAASIKAYRKCVNYNKKMMPPSTTVHHPATIVDTCNNYSEAWPDKDFAGCVACYNNEHLGCHYNIPGFSRSPGSINEMGTKFMLITDAQNPAQGQRKLAEPATGNLFDSTQLGTFVPGQKTLIMLHGLQDTPERFYKVFQSVGIKSAKWNIIAVDWRQGASPDDALSFVNINEKYSRAASNTRLVGRQVANFISQLITARLVEPSDIHLIGHSLGAHVAGYAGKWHNRMYPGERLGRITGLDPAGKVFEYANVVHNLIGYWQCVPIGWWYDPQCKWDLTETEKRRNRLDRTDADFVDVIHTSGALFSGTTVPMGHADFYPNGGDDLGFVFMGKCHETDNVSKTTNQNGGAQSGLLKYMTVKETDGIIQTCPHMYAVDFFLASIHNKCYKTQWANSYGDYQNGNYLHKKKFQMGYYAKKGPLNDNNTRKFFIDTEINCWAN